MKNKFYKLLDVNSKDELKKLSKNIKMPLKKLRYYGDNGIIPLGEDREVIKNYTGLSEIEFKIKMGDIDFELLDLLSNNSKKLSEILDFPKHRNSNKNMQAVYTSEYGELFNGDSLELMKEMESNSIDLIFADPPFNIGKEYESQIDDKLDKETYLRWTENWLSECVRLLKPGGSFFIWNLPKWNTFTANYLDQYLTMRHWISVDMKYGLPISGKLYPAHYSLLYYTKGEKPNTFNNERIPLEVCKTCGHELKDYGGYKSKMNPNGVNLSDVWNDIYPVRHSKYKTRGSNQLPLKLLDRILSIASKPGDLVFDPFGGSGTTYIVAEILRRNWIGCEVGPIKNIIDRFSNIDTEYEQIEIVHRKKNQLFLPEIVSLRRKNGYWLPEDFLKESEEICLFDENDF